MHGAPEFDIDIVCFLSCLSSIFHHYAPVPPLCNGKVYPVSIYFGNK